jgi:hypothetical protein
MRCCILWDLHCLSFLAFGYLDQMYLRMYVAVLVLNSCSALQLMAEGLCWVKCVAWRTADADFYFVLLVSAAANSSSHRISMITCKGLPLTVAAVCEEKAILV